jgi:hypothetical protein
VPVPWHRADAGVITNQLDPVGVVYLLNDGCVVDRSTGPAEFITRFLAMIASRLGVAA